MITRPARPDEAEPEAAAVTCAAGKPGGSRAAAARPRMNGWPTTSRSSPSPSPIRRARALPRPRGHQHDEDPGRGTGPQKRGDARRRQRQEAGSRAGGGRDKSGADWLAGDWGGVSDEQYWAELSADKPLATTARSAQAADGGARPDAATWGETRTRTRSRPGHPRNRPRPWPPRAPPPPSSASVPGQPRPGRPPSEAGPPAPPEPFGFADPGATAGSSASSGPWADPMSAGSGDTDPSIGMGGWQDAASDTAAWQMPDRDAPGDAGLTGMGGGPADQPVVLGAEPSLHRQQVIPWLAYPRPGAPGRAQRAVPIAPHTIAGATTRLLGAGMTPTTATARMAGATRATSTPAARSTHCPARRPRRLSPADGWYSAPTSPGGTPSHWQPPSRVAGTRRSGL